MLLGFITTVLANFNKYKGSETKFLEDFSLIPPHVGSNGRDDSIEFKNHYLIRSRSKFDYTQLGFKSPETFG